MRYSVPRIPPAPLVRTPQQIALDPTMAEVRALAEWCDLGMADLVVYLARHAEFAEYLRTHGRA